VDVGDVIYFASPAAWRAWLEEHHASAGEAWVGFHRKATGRQTLTWAEAVDEALCFGWIDGIRKRVDDTRYTNRFTPRRPGSAWSRINIARVGELTAQGRMRPAGLAAFEARREDRSGIYSFEQPRDAVLPADYERRLRADAAAWAYFSAAAPSYRRAVIHWILSAKREETRLRRLEQLIADSAAGRRVPPLTPPARPSRSGS
jgi:uncharacterized protein YdeI (YjbR/CyaY-like superfamily)